MQKLVNKENKDIWIRPWDAETPDFSVRDDRYFALLVKGALSWLNRNFVLYGKSINHYILSTGSAYLYLENNGYEYTWCETTGENTMYTETPRCIVSLGEISVNTSELGAYKTRGVYERVSTASRTHGQVLSYNADMRRLPIEMKLDLKYIFSTFNESIIFVQELFEKIIFQKYFKFNYLGQVLDVSIEFNPSTSIEINKIDFSSSDPNQKTIELSIILNTNMPIIDTDSESLSSNIITDVKQKPSGIFDAQSNSKYGDYNLNKMSKPK